MLTTAFSLVVADSHTTLAGSPLSIIRSQYEASLRMIDKVDISYISWSSQLQLSVAFPRLAESGYTRDW